MMEFSLLMLYVSLLNALVSDLTVWVVFVSSVCYSKKYTPKGCH